MPVFDFQCVECGKVLEHNYSTYPYPCSLCSGRMKRKFQVAIKKTFTPHYNSAVGKYISNEHEFREELRRKSDETSESSGTEHNYTMVDLRDKPGVTEDAADAIEQGNRIRGWSHKTKTTFL